MEAKEAEVSRLRRRVAELEELRDTLSMASATGGRVIAWEEDQKSRGAGARFQRERDLEGVVESLRKVSDKLRVENERLRKGGGADEWKVAEAEKKAVAEKKRADKLQEELAGVQAKLRSLEDAGLKLTQRQQLIAQLRRQLKSKEDELGTTVRRAEELEESLEGERRRVAAAEGRIQALEAQQLASRAAGANKDELRRAESEVVSLKEQLRQLQRERERDRETMQTQISSRAADSQRKGDSTSADVSALKESLRRATDEGTKLRSELQGLREENAKLRSELSAFDLDFFEEIENLKYAHAEAVRKLALYEGRGARR